jgi:putative endonuclease
MGPGRTGTLGGRAERAAQEFLVREGLTPVSNNYRSRGGEIDLIMLHGSCLVFIEVRYRTRADFSSPEMTVDSHKQRKIIRTAAVFIASMQRFATHTVRFDVVAMTGDGGTAIRWIQDAFRPQDSRL